MKNIKVSAKLIVSFTIVIILTVAVSLAGHWGMRQIKEAADNMYVENVLAIDALGLIRENFALQRNATRELIVFGALSDRYHIVEARLRNLEQQMEDHIAMYIPTIRNDEEQEAFDSFLDAYYNSYGDYKTEFLQYTSAGQLEKSLNLMQTRADSLVSHISGILSRVHEINVTAAETSLMNNNEMFEMMTLVETIVLICAICIVVLLVIYLTQLISKPLKHVSRALERMSITGNLELGSDNAESTYMDVCRRDEIGMATRAITKLLLHIWDIDRHLSRIAGGDFSFKVKTLSDRDTMGISVQEVADNLNRLFQRLKSAEEQSHAASSAKTSFLAHMSHEIRTPLNAIVGMSHIISRSPGDAEKTSTSIKQIMQSSKHLLNIVNDVLDMSKIESGKFDITNMPFRIKASLSEVISIISQRCIDKSVELNAKFDDLGDYTIIGDRTRLNQVLINLLGNAVKFTDSHGTISLTAETLCDDDTNVKIKFAVTDSGIGISKEQQERLFLPFEQADGNTSQKYGGTGLGLSISRNLVTLMGGELKVESTEGLGSCFYFDIEFEKSAVSGTLKESTDEDLKLDGRRILLAEDVFINREILCELLSDTGLSIEQAEDGKKAVEMFRASKDGWYDLIFMDIQMPYLDGYEATQEIRSMDKADAKTIPIVAMTANAYKEDIERCLTAGMNAHVSKPIDVGALTDTLRHYLQ